MFNKDVKVPLQEVELVGTSSSNSGSHGDMGVVGRWPLEVGPLVLLLARILHNSRNSIKVHAQRIFFRSKIFRPLGYFVSRPNLDRV